MSSTIVLVTVAVVAVRHSCRLVSGKANTLSSQRKDFDKDQSVATPACFSKSFFGNPFQTIDEKCPYSISFRVGYLSADEFKQSP